ncbi:hypothetical protein P3X46_000427 [Hevea brasiliensis]|uniref:Uncharacterized protein n=1 Tax=Hevea brasiliensis TaxID=3981 RepID=A0ABQ9NBT1_HEVBR|nr:hypothetical protein P3X46_000427 [Hevea brasiliensis]
MDIEVHLNCHWGKLQILMVAAGIDEYETLRQKYGLNPLSAIDIILKENPGKHGLDLVMEEVKAISHCVSQLKMDSSLNSNGVVIPIGSIIDIQTLLLAVMCHVAINCLSKRSSATVIADETEQKQGFCFVDSGIAFCKFEHLIPTVPVKTQVALIVAIHDLLAECGICCHLLALDMKLKSNLNSSDRETTQHDKHLSPHSQNRTRKKELKSDMLDDDAFGGIASESIPSLLGPEKDNAGIGCEMQGSDEGKDEGEKTTGQFTESRNKLTEDEGEELELIIDGALGQCFFCLYGLNLRSDSSCEDDLAMHKNTSRGDYQTKEQCADVFQYILLYAKASSRTGLVKLRRVLRAIRKHFPQPAEEVLIGNAIDKFSEAGSEGYLETITKIILPDVETVNQHSSMMVESYFPYVDVYCNLYYFLALSEEISATDKRPGFVLTKEGEEFVQKNANLFKYDLLYNPLRFESWQQLGNIYDEEVDLLLTDGSKHINVAGWRKNGTLPQRVETSQRRSRRCLLVSLALAKTLAQQCEIHELLALVYYDSLQNVVPFYDQRPVVPAKDAAWIAYCENSLKPFKKASLPKQDCSHAFHMEKLCEKLGYSYETSLSYYDKGIASNPLAVDPVYRMHVSCVKLLCFYGKQNLEPLKVLSGYSFDLSMKEPAMNVLGKLAAEMPHLPDDTKDRSTQENMPYNDCISSLEICVEGDLKHFHKAIYILFSLCIEDLVPVALGRFIEALVSSMHQVSSATPHRYIASLEINGKLETLEAINEKIRKRFKNPKLSNLSCAKVCRHASVAWCRSLFWNLTFEDSTRFEKHETKWNLVLDKIKNIIIKRASDENFEIANSLLRSSYKFFGESSCVILPSGLNLYLVPTRLSMETQFQHVLNGVEILNLSIPRKLLLWPYTLLQGHYANISVVLKYCEENIKRKMKKGATTSSILLNTILSTTTVVYTGYFCHPVKLLTVFGVKDGANHGGGIKPRAILVIALMTFVPLPKSKKTQCVNPSPPSGEMHKRLLLLLS